MEDPDGAEKFEHGDWSMRYWHDEIGKVKFDELVASDALLLGCVTYQGFVAAWPTMTDAGEFGERMNSIPKYVVSTTLEEVTWNNSGLIRGNVAEEISRLKQQPGRDLAIFGSAALATSFLHMGLLDELCILMNPVVLGSGNPLFKGVRENLTLKVLKTKEFRSGNVLLYYQPEHI